MESANASETPRSLAGTSSRRHTALMVHDMQVGVAISVACALLCLAGCGGDRPPVIPPPVVTHIFSNPRFDGDIEQVSAGLCEARHFRKQILRLSKVVQHGVAHHKIEEIGRAHV